MITDGLPPDIRQALIDRFDSWEIVEALDLSATDLLDNLSDDILEEKLPALREALGMEPEDEEDEDSGRD